MYMTDFLVMYMHNQVSNLLFTSEHGSNYMGAKDMSSPKNLL